MIAGGMGAPDAPSRKGLAGFDLFISGLGGFLTALQDGWRIEERRLHIGLVSSFFPRRSRATARNDMGEKNGDFSARTECGMRERKGPYRAIRLEPTPIFDMSRCNGCWRCYNQCPTHAIYTRKYRGSFYPGPSETLKGKLGG
jgi:Pyruvate/2-oxoacid:ferredoxin oxidoreductase delta subunit